MKFVRVCTMQNQIKPILVPAFAGAAGGMQVRRSPASVWNKFKDRINNNALFSWEAPAPPQGQYVPSTQNPSDAQNMMLNPQYSHPGYNPQNDQNSLPERKQSMTEKIFETIFTGGIEAIKGAIGGAAYGLFVGLPISIWIGFVNDLRGGGAKTLERIIGGQVTVANMEGKFLVGAVIIAGVGGMLAAVISKMREIWKLKKTESETMDQSEKLKPPSVFKYLKSGLIGTGLGTMVGAFAGVISMLLTFFYGGMFNIKNTETAAGLTWHLIPGVCEVAGAVIGLMSPYMEYKAKFKKNKYANDTSDRLSKKNRLLNKIGKYVYATGVCTAGAVVGGVAVGFLFITPVMFVLYPLALAMEHLGHAAGVNISGSAYIVSLGAAGGAKIAYNVIRETLKQE